MQQCYSLTLTSDTEAKEAFYEQLNAIKGMLPKGYIFMANLTSKMGKIQGLYRDGEIGALGL